MHEHIHRHTEYSKIISHYQRHRTSRKMERWLLYLSNTFYRKGTEKGWGGYRIFRTARKMNNLWHAPCVTRSAFSHRNYPLQELVMAGGNGGVHTVLAEGLSSVPCTQVKQLPTSCNSSFRRCSTLVWPLQALYTGDTHGQTRAHTNALK